MSSHRLASDVRVVTLVASMQSSAGPPSVPGDGDYTEIVYAGSVIGPSALGAGQVIWDVGPLIVE